MGVANPSECAPVSGGSSSTEAMLKAWLASLDAGWQKPLTVAVVCVGAG